MMGNFFKTESINGRNYGLGEKSRLFLQNLDYSSFKDGINDLLPHIPKKKETERNYSFNFLPGTIRQHDLFKQRTSQITTTIQPHSSNHINSLSTASISSTSDSTVKLSLSLLRKFSRL